MYSVALVPLGTGAFSCSSDLLSKIYDTTVYNYQVFLKMLFSTSFCCLYSQGLTTGGQTGINRLYFVLSHLCGCSIYHLFFASWLPSPWAQRLRRWRTHQVYSCLTFRLFFKYTASHPLNFMVLTHLAMYSRSYQFALGNFGVAAYFNKWARDFADVNHYHRAF